MHDDGPMVFSLAEGEPYARAVCEALGKPLSPHEEREFEDGEHKARPAVSVRERDVYVVQTLYGDAHRNANDRLVRLLFFIGALKDAAAARVTAVVPYLAYARKDRKTQPRDPVTTRYVARLFEAVETDRIVTLDVHNQSAYENAFRCRTEHLVAAPLFVERLSPELRGERVVVVSPDSGGVKRAEAFRRRLEAVLGTRIGAAFAEKHRSGGAIHGEALVGDVDGATAVIVDDLISAGHTIARAAHACAAHRARRVIGIATHGVFADEANGVLRDAPIERLLVTDSVDGSRLVDPVVRARLTVVPTAHLFAEAIRRLHAGASIVELSTD